MWPNIRKSGRDYDVTYERPRHGDAVAGLRLTTTPLLQISTMNALGIVSVVLMIGIGQCHLLYPVHDGIDRVKVITPLTFQEEVAKGVAILYIPGTNQPLDDITYNMLQVVGQVLSNKGVVVARLDDSPDQSILQSEGLVSGTVYVFRGGRKSIYYGYRTLETFLSYLRQNTGSLITLIDGKAQKKAFDAQESFRVVGYFTLDSPEYLEYEKAASAHHPEVRFYLVTDAVVAPHLRLNTTGEVHVYKPFDKHGQPLPNNPCTEADISTYLSTNRYSALHRITKHNVHSLDSLPADGVHVMAFMRQASAQGYPASKLLRKMVKHGVNTTTTTIYAIDPDDFPLMVDHWESIFNTSLESPALGIVNFTDHKSRWVDIAAIGKLNTTEEKYASLHDWLLSVENGSFPIDPPPPEPEPDQTPQTEQQQDPGIETDQGQTEGSTVEQEPEPEPELDVPPSSDTGAQASEELKQNIDIHTEEMAKDEL